jgi:hypothetical protein
LFGFFVIWVGEDTWATDLRGKFALSGMGGVSWVMGTGFSSQDKIKNNYGFGVSAEYFFLESLSGGLALIHNSFQGDWYYWSGDPGEWSYNSADWQWTNISLFAKFVIGPELKASPYFKGGVGLYIPWMKDWSFSNPDIIYTHSSYGKGQFGWSFGFGVRYHITKKVLVFLEIPLNVIYTNGLVMQGVDIPVQIGPTRRFITKYHEIHDRSQYINIFAGVSFFLGTGE